MFREVVLPYWLCRFQRVGAWRQHGQHEVLLWGFVSLQTVSDLVCVKSTTEMGSVGGLSTRLMLYVPRGQDSLTAGRLVRLVLVPHDQS